MNKIPKVVTIFSMIVFFVGSGLGMSRAVAGTNYYISSSLGSDSNDGLTAGTAWKTMHNIYYKSIYGPYFQPGDSILLKKGDSWVSMLRIRANGTELNPIMISTYGDGSKPLLRGHVAPAPWDSVEAHPGIFSAAIEMGVQFATVFNGPNRLQVVPSTGLDLSDPDDLDTYLSSFSPGSFGPAWGGIGINSNGNPDIIWIRTSNDSIPANVKIFWHAPINIMRPSSYVTVEDMEITESEFAIDIEGSDHIVVRNNDISDIYDLGIYLRWDNTNCLVENNNITRTGNNALYILTGSDNILRGNTVSYVIDTIMDIPTGGDQCGIGLQESSNNLVEYNNVSYIESQGLDFYREVGTTMRYNYFYHVGQGSVPYGTDLNIYNNIFDVDWQPGGHGRGMNVVNTGGGIIRVYNNVFYRVAGGISVSTAEDSVIYRNNIVYSLTPDQWLIWFVNDKVSSDYNLFYGSEKVHTHAGEYTSLADYQATGHETHSFLGEPEFVSAVPVSAMDFNLKPTSPAIDMGQDLKLAGIIDPADPYLDYAGISVPQGSTADIGSFEFESVTGIETPQQPSITLLKQNIPNPFNPVTEIRFELPRAVHVKLCVYNVKGELIATLVNQHMTKGRKEVTWSAKNKQGQAVSSGIYFYRLIAGDFVQTKKMVLLR